MLVGTTSTEKSELLSSLLAEQETNLLNAKPENVEPESEIVAQAGRAGAVAIATNMAGQGTDIILGGNSDYMARLKLREVLLGRLVSRKTTTSRRFRCGGRGRVRRAAAPTLPAVARLPCPLTDDTDQALGQLARDLVKAWGDQA